MSEERREKRGRGEAVRRTEWASEPPRARRAVLAWIVIVPGVLDAFSIAVFPVLLLVHRLGGSLTENEMMALMLILSKGITLVLMALVLAPMLRADLRALRESGRRQLFTGFLRSLCLTAAVWGLIELLHQLFSSVGDSANQEMIGTLWRSLSGGSAVLMAVSLILLGPAGEELMFRGTICRMFGRRHPALGVVLSSLLFGAVHMQMTENLFTPASVANFGVYVLMGLAFSLVYVREKNLLYPVLMHLLWNGVATLLMR